MSGVNPESPGPVYEFHRTDVPSKEQLPRPQSMDYSSNAGSESYYHHDGTNSSVTGHAGTHANRDDATEVVHEMHLALLYLLSNPEEFKKAIHSHPPRGVTTLSDWNAEYDDEEESVITATTANTPLPFVVFADDAEVVLPQAHTASQLFGIEQVEGIELEAAAGIPALSQLFLRWLALMPGGDHLNIIDPPGLTVMRIAGGRYRVTAAHRVIWTWMNEFASLAEDTESFGEGGVEKPNKPALQVGDLVTLTIVDVFETDNQGKLLSYCPTFDNRAVAKTNQATETIRKSSHQLLSLIGRAQKAVVKSEVNKKASAQLQKMGIIESARHMAENVKHRVDEAVQQMNSPSRTSHTKQSGADEESLKDVQGFEQAMTAAEAAVTGASSQPGESDIGVTDVTTAEI
eukprot:Nitzschia sp. Nitz4//scaffold1_size375055//312163//313444//NITZ4_000327-RA/size375055-processed-gene-0.390-mRNA-1//1//CDS//3329541198//4157//frame0